MTSLPSNLAPWYALRDEYRDGWMGTCRPCDRRESCFCRQMDRAMTAAAHEIVAEDALRRYQERMNGNA